MIQRHFKLLIYTLLLLTVPLVSIYPEDADFVNFEVARKHFRKGIVYFNNLNYLAAAEFFRKAVEKYPDYFSARDYMARSYRLAGFKNTALFELRKALDIYPDNVAVKNRVESILFRDSSVPSGTDEEFVLQQKLSRENMRRFGFPDPMDMAVDNEKNLYVTSLSASKIVKIDPNGSGKDIFKPSFGGGLYGIDYRDGILAVSDFRGDEIFVLSLSGKILKKFGGSGNGEGLFHGPEGLCFDSLGNIYVVDSGNFRVQKFDDSGKVILSFGKKGAYEGEFENPSDVAFLKGKVYVTDTGSGKISVYDQHGNFIRNISDENIASPRGISTRGSELIISDEKNGVLIMNPDTGKKRLFSRWGKDGQIQRAVASIYDSDGFLYVLDTLPGSVYCFSPVEKQYSNLELQITSVDTASFPVVAFYLNVRGRDGRPVYGLGSENFKLTEDSSGISGIYTDYLKNSAKSASMVLAVDRSAPVASHHNDLPWIADFVLKKMRKNDSLELINFNSNVWTGIRFDWSRRRILKALKKREYGKGKQTGSALYQSLTRLVPKLNRRGVIFVTDGTVTEDSFRQYTPDVIIDYAREHYIPIFIISLKEPSEEIMRIAEQTGGKVIKPSDIDSMRTVYDRIRNADEYRYVAVYNTYKLPSFKGWWADVKIEVDYKGQKGVQWGGYFVP